MFIVSRTVWSLVLVHCVGSFFSV